MLHFSPRQGVRRSWSQNSLHSWLHPIAQGLKVLLQPPAYGKKARLRSAAISSLMQGEFWAGTHATGWFATRCCGSRRECSGQCEDARTIVGKPRSPVPVPHYSWCFFLPGLCVCVCSWGWDRKHWRSQMRSNTTTTSGKGINWQLPVACAGHDSAWSNVTQTDLLEKQDLRLFFSFFQQPKWRGDHVTPKFWIRDAISPTMSCKTHWPVATIEALY